MRSYTTAQLIGDRSHQCDATAVFTTPTGASAYVLLDGIGSDNSVRDWTRTAARRLARTAAMRGDAEAGLRATYDHYATDPDRRSPYAAIPSATAAAIVVVTVPGKAPTVAWAGDSRAYVLTDGAVTRHSNDHNLRRVYPPCDTHDGGNRNRITSYLGASGSDDDVRGIYGHPAIESGTLPDGPLRLLLASDGAYEPHEDAEHDLADLLTGSTRDVARRFVHTAVETARAVEDPYADNATVLVADLT
ncbi:mucin-2 [Streptomyces sp. NPDC058299]|uniref:mucin-2 n=1 Tax=Streptomyces sp. NPDC058299 TaxID=3346435 RepID=UPI0036E91424